MSWDYSPAGTFHELVSTISFVAGLAAITLMLGVAFSQLNSSGIGPALALVPILVVGLTAAGFNYVLNRTTVHHQLPSHAIYHSVFVLNLGVASLVQYWMARMKLL